MRAEILRRQSEPKLKDNSHWLLTVHICRPYIIDLNSTNGTYLNNQRIDPRRYYELKEKVSFTIHLVDIYLCLFSVNKGCS